MQYFAVQLVVALRWPRPYNISRDTISDLGNSACGTWNGRYVCSPWHDLMNGSFIVLGITMLLGSVLIFRRYGKGRLATAGFTAMGLSGLGVVMVGIFPENSIPALHGLGSALPFTLGNAALIALAISLAMPLLLRLYVSLCGVAALLALAAYASGHYLGLGEGGMERVVAYPQTICLAVIGCYLIAASQPGRSRADHRTTPRDGRPARQSLP
ncbi:MAG: DUF998 domain-containing protein [Actinomycetota bacterium]|nr:DUF998 domain-containing protein [Actinomycetota bacterium]